MPDPIDRLTAALADRYRLEREVGAGGMATVYLAEDLKHQRKVALKVLRPDLAAVLGPDRFIREITVAANLQHPHILGLIDSGEAGGVLYYIMPFVEGESLRQLLRRGGALPFPQALRLGGQIARALDYAHRRGVIHRDIKPENVLLQDGQAAVADFGIALAFHHTGPDRLTETGCSLGTPAYMSPEQITGTAAIDGRSDQYSLACVVYELVTGTPPFGGPTGHAVMVKHVTEAAPALPAFLPAAVAAAIAKALAKDPAGRFDTAGEFAAALEGEGPVVHSPALGGAPATVVVLPFEDSSPNTEEASFSTGLADELIGDLSKIRAIRVISRTTSARLKGSTKSLRAIGRDLNVRYALTGSVRRAGGSLRIMAELVDTDTDTPVWGEKYSGTIADVFDLQERLARQIVDALKVTLTPEESQQLAARPIDNLVAYERYLVARPLVFSGDPARVERARTLIREALIQTGDNGTLLGLLALSYLLESDAGPQDRDKVAVADQLATKALAIAPDLSGPYDMKGWATARLDLNTRAAIPWHRRAVEKGRSAESLGYLAYHLATAGLIDEAVALMEEAVARSPHDEVSMFHRAHVLLWSGRAEAAANAAHDLARVRVGWSVGRHAAGIVLLGCGRPREAVAYLNESVQTGPPIARELAGHWINAFAEPERTRPQLSSELAAWASASDERASWIADLFAHVGDRDRALHWIRIAVDRGFTNDRWWAEWDPYMATHRDDPMFREIVASARNTRLSEPV